MYAKASVFSITTFLLVFSPIIHQTQAAEKSSTHVTPSDTVVGRPLEAPVNTRPLSEKFWFNESWHEQGIL
ncbi:MAG: hypothetical protein JAY67_14370, partial [Candidatus Thiodiazotropha taylori]|nr:hypothetical protein [Candidatus Thiodiazotropha taylori]